MCERNTDQRPLACTSSETGQVTQACALPRIQASDLMLCRMMPNQLIHTDQGAHGVFSRRDHILSYKTSFSKLKIEIISCTFSDHNGTKTRIHKKKPEQHTHIRRLSNTLWHHEWISHEIKEEVKKYFETNENETTTTPKTMGQRHAVPITSSTVIKVYLKKEEKPQINNLSWHLKDLWKEQSPKWVEGSK